MEEEIWDAEHYPSWMWQEHRIWSMDQMRNIFVEKYYSSTCEWQGQTATGLCISAGLLAESTQCFDLPEFSCNPFKSRQIFLLQKCFHQGFLISPDAMDSPGTKSSGKIVSRYLDQIVGWELENLNNFLKKIRNLFVTFSFLIDIQTHHLNDLHFKFSLKLFLLDTSPKSPRSGPIRS